MTFWWTISGLLLVVFIVSLFPTFQEALGQTLNDVPDSLKSIVGDSAAYDTLTGYVDLQVFAQMVFLPIILGIIIGGEQIAGEENEGTLQSLLAHPVKRSQAYLQKFAAVTAIVGITTLGLFVGTGLGAVIIHESIDAGRLFATTLMAFLISMVFTALTYALGAAWGRRGVAGAFAGVLAFATYLLTSLAEGVKALKPLDYLSPFHYYNKPSPLEAGLQIGDMFILLTLTFVLFAIGFVFFTKRDIFQR